MKKKADSTVTTIRMNPQTRDKVNALIAEGYAPTITAIIMLAIDRMYNQELKAEPTPAPKQEPEPEPKRGGGGWGLT